jgi:hypothetical protein
VGAASLTHPIAPENSMHVRWKAVKLAGPIVPISSQIGIPSSGCSSSRLCSTTNQKNVRLKTCFSFEDSELARDSELTESDFFRIATAKGLLVPGILKCML